MAVVKSGEIDGRIAMLYHCMANLIVYFSRFDNRHLRWPGKLRRRRSLRFNVGRVHVLNTPPARSASTGSAAWKRSAGAVRSAARSARQHAECTPSAASAQRITLVHFSAQRKRFLWDRGALRGYAGGVGEVSRGIKQYQGVFRVYFVSATAQVELRSGPV